MYYKHFLKTSLLITLCLTLAQGIQGQYTLDQALSDVKQNSALHDLHDLILQDESLSNEILKSRNLPQINLTAQASYQSETSGLALEFPGVDIPRLSKDQYRLQSDLSQLLYDGGISDLLREKNRITAKLSNNDIQQQIKDLQAQCIQLFFSIKEVEIQQEQLDLKLRDIDIVYATLKANVENGTVLKSELYNLTAEKYLVDQKQIELITLAAGLRESLYLLTRNPQSKTATLLIPQQIEAKAELNSETPELSTFQLQNESLLLKQEIDDNSLIPKIFAFGQLGYGKPGLNFLKNEFSPYYVAGVKAQWNLSSFYKKDKNRQLNLVQQQKLIAKQDLTETSLTQKNVSLFKDIEKLKSYEETDMSIIELRKQIKETARIQLENGVITSSEYILKINDEGSANITKHLHELLQIKAQYLIHHNNGWNL